MASGQGAGLQVNGDLLREGEESSHHMVSDDMLYKLSKKIAQLTKVIYSLNTKNDDMEFDMENMRHGYEDKLEKVSLMPRQPYSYPLQFTFKYQNSFVCLTHLAGVLIQQLTKLLL